MRNLTLGVLIVTGGTLAALPFRRHSIVIESSDVVTEATGPILSALDLPTQESTFASVASEPIELPLPDSLPIWHRETRAFEQRRRIDVPLSFEDLMAPIKDPEPIRQQFSATSDVRHEEADRERAARRSVAFEMPPIERHNSVPNWIETASTETESAKISSPDTTSVATGSLASTAWHASSPDRLPKPSADADQHQWIRQP